MRDIMIGGKVKAPEIALGCMRINGLEKKQLEDLVRSAMERGVNFFDHADIYAKGEAESFFAEAVDMKPSLREKMILQTKCGIRSGVCYDFSKEHILKSVDESLKRLRTNYVDFLLLHRPDILVDPDEVAEAFAILEKAGKVKHFGVSNENPGQMALLNQRCGDKITTNQLQLSVAHCPVFDASINVNMMTREGSTRDGGVMEYCRFNNITLQAWSPFQYGFFEGVFIGSDKFPALNKVLDRLAEQYSATPSAIAIAWILRHPAKIQAIVGTTNKQRFMDICEASNITLTREEWYELYLSAGKQLP